MLSNTCFLAELSSASFVPSDENADHAMSTGRQANKSMFDSHEFTKEYQRVSISHLLMQLNGSSSIFFLQKHLRLFTYNNAPMVPVNKRHVSK